MKPDTFATFMDYAHPAETPDALIVLTRKSSGDKLRYIKDELRARRVRFTSRFG